MENTYTLDQTKEAIKKHVDQRFWARLFDESGVKDFMDSTAKKELGDSLYRKESIPDFVKDNIISTFSDLYENRNDMLERGIINLFKSLSWDYKTNQPFKFRKRIIISNALRGSIWSHWSIQSYALDKLEDLQRAFCIYDKKPIPDQKNSMSKKLERFSDHKWEGEYFDLKFYENGNIHIIFKRHDLVEDMNRTLSKHFPNTLASEAR